MSFNIPNLQQIIDNAEADLSHQSVRLTLRPTIEGWLARMLAGAVRGLYMYIQNLWLQIWPWTASDEVLDGIAEWWGLSRYLANTAQGLVSVEFLSAMNLPQGSLLRNDAGFLYTTASSYNANTAKNVNLIVYASLAGAEGNFLSGSRLSLVSPLSGIGQIIVGIDGLTQGRDPESNDALRERVQRRIAAPPALGTKEDYVNWAKSTAGVTRAWCFPWNNGEDSNPPRVSGIAEQIVLVVCANDNDPLLTASPAALALAKEAIALNCPANIQPRTRTVQSYPVTVQFNSLRPNNQDIIDAVTVSLAELFKSSADLGKIVLASQIRTTIGTVPGVIDYSLFWPNDSSPSAIRPFQIYTFAGITVTQ